MEIDIKVSGLEPLAAAIREAADIQYRAAKLRTDALAITTKSFFDALQIVLPAIISGSSMARAKDETDGGSALETSSTSDAPMAPNAVTPAGSAEDQGEPASPVKVAVENTSIEDAPVKNPGTARDSREARRVVEPDAAKEPPIEKTPAAEAEKEPQEQGGAATPETSAAVTMSDVMTLCEGLKKDYPAVFTREFSRKFASEAFAEAGLSKPPVAPDEVSRLFEVVSRKEAEFRKANHA